MISSRPPSLPSAAAVVADPTPPALLLPLAPSVVSPSPPAMLSQPKRPRLLLQPPPLARPRSWFLTWYVLPSAQCQTKLTCHSLSMLSRANFRYVGHPQVLEPTLHSRCEQLRVHATEPILSSTPGMGVNHARQHSRTMIRVRQARMVVDLQHANIPQYRTEGSEISMSTSFT